MEYPSRLVDLGRTEDGKATVWAYGESYDALPAEAVARIADDLKDTASDLGERIERDYPSVVFLTTGRRLVAPLPGAEEHGVAVAVEMVFAAKLLSYVEDALIATGMYWRGGRLVAP